MEPVLVPFERFERLRPQRTVPSAFEALWVCGTLEALEVPTIAVVGTRAATAYGKAVAAQFARDFARAGCCVISGLALGIDATAHRAALAACGVTVGVLGSGHNRFFPARNRPLGEQLVAAGGAVLSPFAPEVQARPWNFLQRNGIVAALADAVVVIEAPARSGALNTANWAAGRIPVYAVPGDVDRAHVAGCHALIRDGAILARAAADVLDDLHITRGARGESDATRRKAANPLHAEILEALTAGERSVGELLAATQLQTAGLAAALSILELEGAIEARAGARYALRDAPLA